MNNTILTFSSINPFRIGVIFLDKDDRIQRALERSNIKYRVRNAWGTDKRNVLVKAFTISKKYIDKFAEINEKFYNDLLILEEFDEQIEIYELYDKIFDVLTMVDV